MKRNLFVYILFQMISLNGFSQFNLTIEITAIRNDNGKIMLQLYDENQKVLTQETGIIKDSTSVFSVRDLNPGKYAVRYYHDENQNEKMDTNAFGKPTEGYGFSNSVTGKTAPPPFERWLFEIRSDTMIILKPVY